MNRVSRHKLIALLAVVSIGIAAAGEALHMLPGMGHYEQTPCGTHLRRGGTVGSVPAASSGDISDAITSRHGSRILGLEECSVCRLVATSFDATAPIPWAPPTDDREDLEAPSTSPLHDLRSDLYSARGPPGAPSLATAV